MTKQEIMTTLKRLIAEVTAVALPQSKTPQHLISMDVFTSVCEFYPPTPSYPWWDPSQSMYGQAPKLFLVELWTLLEWVSRVYHERTEADHALLRKTQFSLQPGFREVPVFQGRSIFEEASRLIHKFIVHAIYFTRYRSNRSKTEVEQAEEDVSHLHYGRIPVDVSEQHCCAILYFRHTNGCFVPIIQGSSEDGCDWRVVRCPYASLEGHRRAMVMFKNKIVQEDGIMVINRAIPSAATAVSPVIGDTTSKCSASALPTQRSVSHDDSSVAVDVFAFAGSQNARPFIRSSVSYNCVDPSALVQSIRLLGLTLEDEKGFEQIIEECASLASTEGPKWNLVGSLQRTLGEDFPRPQQRLVILLPRSPVETQCMEVLLLQSIKDQAENQKDASALEMVMQLEEQTQMILGDILEDSRRALMERMIEQQNTEHARITSRQKAKLQTRALAPLSSDGLLPCETSKDSSSSPSKEAWTPSASTSSASVANQQQQQKAKLETILEAREQLLISSRQKFRHVEALALQMLGLYCQQAGGSRPHKITNSGSHRVVHFSNSRSATLVEVHDGKDKTVPRRSATRLFEPLVQAIKQMMQHQASGI